MSTACPSKSSFVNAFMDSVKQRNPNQPEFLQAVQEVVESLEPVIQKRSEYVEGNILERIVEPERVIHFRVPWVNDKNEVQVNRGYRVEFNSAIGPVHFQFGWYSTPIKKRSIAPLPSIPMVASFR